MIKIEPGDICENCHTHQATEVWVSEGGSLAASRDYMQSKWCKCCALKEQIKYAEGRAQALPFLKAKLEEACH